MKQTKTLEIMWVNVKIREKIRKKATMEIVKTFQPKPTLHLPILLQLHSIQVPFSSKTLLKQNGSYTNAADDQTSLPFLINITKSDYEIEHAGVAENNLFMMEYKQRAVR